MIEENVGVLGDDLLLVDLVGVDVVKAVPLAVRGVPADGRVVAAL